MRCIEKSDLCSITGSSRRWSQRHRGPHVLAPSNITRPCMALLRISIEPIGVITTFKLQKWTLLNIKFVKSIHMAHWHSLTSDTSSVDHGSSHSTRDISRSVNQGTGIETPWPWHLGLRWRWAENAIYPIHIGKPQKVSCRATWTESSRPRTTFNQCSCVNFDMLKSQVELHPSEVIPAWSCVGNDAHLYEFTILLAAVMTASFYLWSHLREAHGSPDLASSLHNYWIIIYQTLSILSDYISMAVQKE